MFINPDNILQMLMTSLIVLSPFIIISFYLYKKGNEGVYLKQTSFIKHFKNISDKKRYYGFWKKEKEIRIEILTELKLSLLICLFSIGLLRIIIGISNLSILVFGAGLMDLIKAYILPEASIYSVYMIITFSILFMLYPLVYYIAKQQMCLETYKPIKE